MICKYCKTIDDVTFMNLGKEKLHKLYKILDLLKVKNQV